MNRQHKIRGFDKRKASAPYLVVLQGLRGLSLKDTKFGRERLGEVGQMQAPQINTQAQYFVQYHATLHSNQPPPGLAGFYGRTCTSTEKRLVASPTDPTMFDSNEEAFMFFHTSFTEASSCLLLEVEVVKQEGYQKERASAGFAVCNLFDFPKTAQAVIVQQGSPRMFGAVQTDLTQANRVGKTMLTFEFQNNFAPFAGLKELVPQNCLVSYNDVIPGLNTATGRFAKPRPDFQSPLSTEPMTAKPRRPIYLHNVSLVCSPEFERQFESFLRYVVNNENEEFENTMSSVDISQRRIHVGVHNTWKDLAEPERLVVLEEPDREGIARGTASVELPQYVEDPLVALTFRVEFGATLPVRPAQRAVSHTVAWQVHLPKINAQGEVVTEHVELDCKIGNQVSMQNDLVWGVGEASAANANTMRQTFRLRVCASVSTDKKAGARPTIDTSKPSFPFDNRPPTGSASPAGSKAAKPWRQPSPPAGALSPANRPGSSGYHRPPSHQPASHHRGPGSAGSARRQSFGGAGSAYPSSGTGSQHGHKYGARPLNNTQPVPSTTNYYGQPAPTDAQFPQYDPHRPHTSPPHGSGDPRYQESLNQRFDALGTGIKTIMADLQRLEADRREQLMRDQRVGTIDYELQSQQQVQMIGNVFYNLLNHVGMDKHDPKIMELSNQVKEMMQTRKFDNLMGLKVPHLKHGVMNLLKVVDLSTEDQIELIKMGYGDLLRNPTA